MLSPLRAPRMTEQPLRHGSSARCVRDPMTQGYWPGGAVGHVAWRQGNRLGAQERAPLLLAIPIGRTIITLYTPPVPYGLRATSVQVDSIITACASAWHMVNNADPPRREVDISLGTIYFL